MSKILLMDPEKCSACRRCELACSFVKEKIFSPVRSRVQLVRIKETGTPIPVVCQHCAEPVCVDVCPTKALMRDNETGAVILNEDLCVGCRMCFIACPIGAISIKIDNKKVMKCDLCKGKPACVEACGYGALEYVEADEASYHKRREGIGKLSRMLEKIVE